MFNFGSKAARKAAPVAIQAAAPAESEVSPSTAASNVVVSAGPREVVELLEADLKRAGKRMEESGRATRACVGETVAIVDDLRKDTDHLVERTSAAHANINTLVEGFQDLHQTAEEIGRRAQSSQRLIDDAGEVAKVAGRSVEDLRVAIEQIQAVVSLIADVAGQTNLLALNATIEAARAGSAGRGFAVVASEVKALAVETQKATNEIGSTIARLRDTAQANISAVDKIIGLVAEIGPVFGEVSRSVQTQIGTTAEIGRSAAETARFADEVAERARRMSDGMTRAVALGRTVESATDQMNGAVGDMTRQLVTVLRQTPEADRRRHDRWPAELRGDMRVGAQRTAIRTIDISLGGALVVPEREIDVSAGARLELEFGGLGRIEATLVGRSANGLHVTFSDRDAAATQRIRDRITQIEVEYRPLIERAESASARVTNAIAEALVSGRLNRSDLFDTDYRPIAGSSPIQFEARSLKALEEILPPVQEAILGEDKRMTFCACVDVNGWLPVHNKIYSHPQRPGDTVWNVANSRNKRIYDDRTGLIAARNTRPFLVQSYLRDLGGGNIVAMKEVDVPIVIEGRHWGGFRTAYRM